MSEKLKPCPFCGHKTIQESFFDLPCKVYRIRCPRCYIFMDNTSENMVMKAWNTRPIEDKLLEEVEDLKIRLQQYRKALEYIAGYELSDDYEVASQAGGWLKRYAKEALKGANNE